jgi:hypothetical protein
MAILMSQEYNLRYRLKEGKSYRFYQETSMNINQSLGFIEQEIKNEFKGVTRFIPVGKQGNNLILQTCFESMVVNIEGMMFSIRYDSSKPVPKEDRIANIYSRIIGKEFKTIITPQGKVVKVIGINTIIDEAVNDMEDLQPGVAGQLKASLAGHLGEASLRGNLELLLALYPTTKKKVGDQWSTNTHLQSALKAKLNNQWTLKGDADKKWTLSGIGKIHTNGEEASMNGMKVIFNLTGNQQSEFTVNQADGWFVSGKQKQDMEGTVTMNVSAQMPQGMQIPMKIKSNTYLERR